ncbi:hypothetical protein [Paraburkholderia domus]|jgi:hypothetical protein|uniref:Uncharacterized protein n=1 Tax=Paraburkholderia domus TaxID=2793075 RepID=A0A9N8MTV1_9BURK|nr:hypothetical protein [Paraburkholderia domus]MBK5051186.1 hypothetical protein [Burkholderia sp. R-70006]MBK5061158.1 hypothetical protein [Burkholderia sp. R-70199]MBK5166354.1 hypothetical protein [Burkholderia sp. R-70211]MBK5179568.1 hypothetical protein [Burkholderia sp. R-69749]MCI0146507.1 hypothetical protein [Paraburkholderia sediminicola]
MAKVEMTLQFIENGSNSMVTYQAFVSAANSRNDSLSIIQNGTNLIATISNVAPMLKPVRIMTNQMSATSALIRVVTDWQNPDKRIQPGDVLTIISAAGTIAVTVLVLAEIGPGAAVAIGALVLAADLQSTFQPYINSAKIWLGNYMSNLLQISQPASVASASLYWSSLQTGSGYVLASYDEILTQKGLFICLSDKGVSGTGLMPMATPVPGSFTPVNEAQYKENYCQYLSVKQGWSDIVSGMDYCKNVQFR